MTKKKTNQTKEILWNVVNSILAGALVFLGSIADGDITAKGFCAALITFFIVAFTKFYDYWKTQEGEYINLFNFVNNL